MKRKLKIFTYGFYIGAVLWACGLVASMIVENVTMKILLILIPLAIYWFFIIGKSIIEEKINRFNYLKEEISKKNNFEELDKHFLGLDIEQIDLSLIRAKIDNLNHYEKRKNPLIIIVLAISIVLMGVSIIFFINNLMMFFIVFLILGLISLIGDLFLYVNFSLKKVSNIDKDKNKVSLTLIKE